MVLKRSVVLGGLTVAAGLVACAAVERPGFMTAGELRCQPGRPCVVKVLPCPPPPLPEYDPIRVRVGGGATNIFWEAPAGFVFTENGIRFKNNNGDIDPRPGRMPGGQRWHVVDTPRSRFEIKYAIELQNSATGAVCPGPDPVIAND